MAYCNKSLHCINLNKTSQLKSQVNISIKQGFKFGEALGSVYPLLELVFDYLDYNDLQLAASVNKLWQEAAQKILDKRNKISWLTVFQKRRQIQVHYNNNFCYNNAQLGLILFNYRMISLGDRLCCHENDHCQPKKLKDILAEQIIPRGIKYCIIACTGVSSYFSEQITSKSKIAIFDGFILPPMPNVRVSLFDCSFDRLDNYVKSNEKIKCLLLFSKRLLEESIYTILQCFVPKSQWWNCAFGGGVIRRTIVLPEAEKSKTRNSFDNLCITITEDRYCESVFDTASVVIDALTSKEFEEQLLTFKRNIIIRSDSFALRFCCSAKKKKNHELNIFNKLFPNTPLLGLDVGGEFGWDCTNFNDDNQMKKVKHGYPQSEHQWSTVIVFLTWGRILSDNL